MLPGPASAPTLAGPVRPQALPEPLAQTPWGRTLPWASPVEGQPARPAAGLARSPGRAERGAGPRPSLEPLQLAWCELLSRWPWDWFVTVTFRDCPHPERADKLWRTWCSQLNRDLYGVRWYRTGRGVYWARAQEHQARGAIHYHALVGGDRLWTVRRLSWMDVWTDLGGGWARIEPPSSALAVVNYCAKYVTKQGHIDLASQLVRFQQRGLFQLEQGRPTRQMQASPGC